MEGGDSWGISVTGETPQVAIATEEAHRTPPGKRPPAMEINSPHFIFTKAHFSIYTAKVALLP
jgi:hypothetical protein